ncbi:Sec-independent protein translocase family protein [Isoptericola aurantiacus]|uniref:Sec-independent protein translocase TatB n=1 Tax=Isoptericola aurantiacus TaxID=3377839 RepID=UPI00383BB269
MGFFGINGGELVVIVVLALVLIGPERLPRYAAQLGALVRHGKGYLRDAKARVDAELGDELRDVDWQKLDPRQYDPRRIVKEALLDDDPAPRTAPRPPGGPGQAATGSAAATAAATPPVPGAPAPYDDEAT